MGLRLDDCAHCACTTELVGYTRERALLELNEGSLACWNCSEQAEDDHVACVVLYDGDEVVADFRCSRRRGDGEVRADDRDRRAGRDV